MRSRLVASTLLLAVFLVDCQTDGLMGPTGSIARVRPERSTYFPGEVVVVEIENTSRAPILQSMCAGQLQSWNGSRWQAHSIRVCLVGGPSPRRIEARATARDTFMLREGATPGRYRIELRFLAEDGTALAAKEGVSGQFRVVEFRE